MIAIYKTIYILPNYIINNNIEMNEELIQIDKIYIIDNCSKWNFTESTYTNYNQIESLVKSDTNNQESFYSYVDIITLNEEEELKNTINSSHLCLTSEKMKKMFNCIGYKFTLSSHFTKEILSDYSKLILQKQKETDSNNLEKSSTKINIITKSKLFYTIAKFYIEKVFKNKIHLKRYFQLSYLILEKKLPIIILLGGTSGTGKSTLASLIAEQLDISNVISTDHIRHILRNFKSKEEAPILFTSTYDSWKALKSSEIENLSEKQKIIQGYKEQAKMVITQTETVIEELILRKESAVLEGVHINIKFIVNLCTKHKYILPFFVYIGDADKHKERFAVRSKNMTLKASSNKYIQNFDQIRTIQQFILSNAENHRIPAIDNNNVDKSLGILQQTVLRGIREYYIGEKLYDKTNNTMFNFYQLFRKVYDKTLTSKQANLLIKRPNLENKDIGLNDFYCSLEVENMSLKHKKKTTDIHHLSDGEDSKRKNSYKTKNDSNTKTRRQQTKVEQNMMSLSVDKQKFFSHKKSNNRENSSSINTDGSVGYKSQDDNESQKNTAIHETDDDINSSENEK